MTNMFYVIIGSMAGGLSRYYFGGLVQRFSGSTFPYGTLAVNLIGCLLVGFIASIADGRFPIGASARVLLISGFCGAFTTFSAFIFETSYLIKSGESIKAFFNLIISVVAGFIVFRIGVQIGEL